MRHYSLSPCPQGARPRCVSARRRNDAVHHVDFREPAIASLPRLVDPQRQWLQRIAAQAKANLLVDCAGLDDPDRAFKREGSGSDRLDRIFGGSW